MRKFLDNLFATTIIFVIFILGMLQVYSHYLDILIRYPQVPKTEIIHTVEYKDTLFVEVVKDRIVYDTIYVDTPIKKLSNDKSNNKERWELHPMFIVIGLIIALFIWLRHIMKR